MTTDVDTTALTDLDVDLEQAIPCEYGLGCDHEATHRAIARHVSTGTVCHTQFFCDLHTRKHQAFIAAPGINRCTHHHIEVTVRWQPLHPGRR